MKGYRVEEGSPVASMIGLEITGNVIPLEWFNHIKHKNGKPHTTAIMLLADIVYWYRPIEERDEKTGKVTGYRKKFEADKLQRSYSAFANLYGYTKNQIREAIDVLEELGVVSTEFRHPVINGQKLGNVLYIELKVDTLLKITHPLLGLNPIGIEEKPNTPIGFKPDTNTEIKDTEITETTTEILTLWKQLFPKKPQPKPGTYREKIVARWKAEHFRANWRLALETAAKSKTLQSESWFGFEFFIKNDKNYLKMLENWMDWKDQQNYTNGSTTAKGKPTAMSELERYARENGINLS
jgi:hypothetical protein